MSAGTASHIAEMSPSVSKSTQKPSQSVAKARKGTGKRRCVADEDSMDGNDDNCNLNPDEQRRRERRRQVGNAVADHVGEEIEASLSPLRNDILASTNDMNTLKENFEQHEHKLSGMQDAIDTKASTEDVGRIYQQQTAYEADTIIHRSAIASIQDACKQFVSSDDVKKSLEIERNDREAGFERLKLETSSSIKTICEKLRQDFSEDKLDRLTSRISDVEISSSATKEYIHGWTDTVNGRVTGVETVLDNASESNTKRFDALTQKNKVLEASWKTVKEARERQSAEDSENSLKRDKRLDELCLKVEKFIVTQKKVEDDLRRDLYNVTQARQEDQEKLAELEKKYQDVNGQCRSSQQENAELTRVVELLRQDQNSNKEAMSSKLSTLNSDIRAFVSEKHLELIQNTIVLIKESETEAKADSDKFRNDHIHLQSDHMALRMRVDEFDERLEEAQAASRPEPVHEKTQTRFNNLVQSLIRLQNSVSQHDDILARAPDDIAFLEQQQKNHVEICKARHHEHLELGKDYTDKAVRSLRVRNDERNIALWARFNQLPDSTKLNRGWSPDSVVGEAVQPRTDRMILATPVSDVVGTESNHGDEDFNGDIAKYIKHNEAIARAEIEATVAQHLETQLSDFNARLKTIEERICTIKIRADNIQYGSTQSPSAT